MQRSMKRSTISRTQYNCWDLFKKLFYSNSNDNNHMGYNHVIAITNYSYHVQQDCHQNVHEYHYPFTALRMLYEQLRLKLGTSSNGASNMLKGWSATQMNNTRMMQKKCNRRASCHTVPFRSRHIQIQKTYQRHYKLHNKENDKMIHSQNLSKNLSIYYLGEVPIWRR